MIDPNDTRTRDARAASATSLVAERPSGPASGVTLANYHRLQTDMSYTEVVNILESPGVEMSRNEIAGITTVMYMWRAGRFSGANMNAMFQNGGLVSKAQFGLR